MATPETFRLLSNIESFLFENTNSEVGLVGLSSDGELFLRVKLGEENKHTAAFEKLPLTFSEVKMITFISEPSIEELNKQIDELNKALRPRRDLLDIQG